MTRSRLITLLSSGLVAGAFAFASPNGSIATASADPIVDVQIAPPQPRVEVVPVAPSPHHFWIHGYYMWNGRGHVWVPGHYEQERAGYGYREARWVPVHGGHYRYYAGSWYRR